MRQEGGRSSWWPIDLSLYNSLSLSLKLLMETDANKMAPYLSLVYSASHTHCVKDIPYWLNSLPARVIKATHWEIDREASEGRWSTDKLDIAHAPQLRFSWEFYMVFSSTKQMNSKSNMHGCVLLKSCTTPLWRTDASWFPAPTRPDGMHWDRIVISILAQCTRACNIMYHVRYRPRLDAPKPNVNRTFMKPLIFTSRARASFHIPLQAFAFFLILSLPLRFSDRRASLLLLT